MQTVSTSAVAGGVQAGYGREFGRGRCYVVCNAATRARRVDIRWADREEAGEIARLSMISSDGLAAHIWSRMDRPGFTLEQIGAARYARTGVASSFENCLVAVSDGRIVGMAHAFARGAAPGAPCETDPVLRPYSELGVPGSLFLSGLAVDADCRGRGLGSALMDRVERLAITRALPGVSLICFERNDRALAFFKRRGYCEIDRRPLVPHPALHYRDGDAILLLRDV